MNRLRDWEKIIDPPHETLPSTRLKLESYVTAQYRKVYVFIMSTK